MRGEIDGDELTEIQVYVALFTEDSTSSKPFPIRAIGYRFEHGEGPHNFFHAQHVSRFGDDHVRLPSPSWVPEIQPSFPIPATDPMELLLCSLITIYGIGEVADLVDEVTGLRRRMSNMHFLPAGSG